MKEQTAPREVLLPTDLLGRRPARHAGPTRRLALVGTFPPTRCGIATFTASLAASLAAIGEQPPTVVRVIEGVEAAPPAPPVTVAVDRPGWTEIAVRAVQGHDAVVLQHEFGIYGPDSGRAVVDLVRRAQAPVLTTLHTVSPHPSPRERQILEALAAASAFVVVLSESARAILCEHHRIDPSRVEVIPHGTDFPPAAGQEGPVGSGRPGAGPSLLTWGLIGPGKGLDWALAALDILRRSHPAVHWTVAGQTHPKVLAHEGERYRHTLLERVRRLALGDHVTFLDRYLSRHHLHALALGADAVILPYESTEQTSSGVLVEAVRAGVPVVATKFPQAVELEREGAVMTVPHRDPVALAAAVDSLMAHPERKAEMVSIQRRLADTADWRQVARRYVQLAERAAAARVAS